VASLHVLVYALEERVCLVVFVFCTLFFMDVVLLSNI
jgi:hypothetical protein